MRKILSPHMLSLIDADTRGNTRLTWLQWLLRAVLGGILLGQKKYAEAEPLLLAGYAGMKQREAKIPLPGKARLPEAVERLVQLYEGLGKKEQANEWRKKLPAAKPAEPTESKKD